MLVTHSQQELVRHPFQLAPDEKIWKLVNLELEIPYFLVCYEVRSGGSSVRQTAMFWQVVDVTHFCDEIRRDSKISVVQVNLLTPSSSRSKGRWRIDVIKEVWEMRREDQTVIGFVSESGEKFSSPRSRSSKGNLEQIRMLFSV